MKHLIAAALVVASLSACAPQLTPCPTEDYDGPTACVWDAHVRGNGQGQSFIWDGHQIRYTSK